jgi:membrane protein YdbS with pleckstrin-like domain
MPEDPREKRIELSWRLFRLTSMIASGVILIVLIAIDVSFRFVSFELNITIVLVAIFLLILIRLDALLHRMVTRIRSRRHKGWPL